MALLATIVLGGCHLKAQGAAEPAWSHAGPSDSAVVQATPVPTRPDGLHFGEMHHYPDGLDVRVFEIRTAVRGWFPGGLEDTESGDPYTIIRIQLDNNSRAKFDAGFTGKMLYGPELKEAVSVTLDQQIGTPLIAPGENALYDFGFLIPKEFVDDVSFELSIDLEQHEKAYFVGSVRTS